MYPYILPGLFGEHVSSYGLMLGLGVLVCLLVFHYYSKKLEYDNKYIDFIEWLALISIASGVLSACLFQNLYDYINDPEGFTWSMSLTFMGGLFGGVVVFLSGYAIFGRGKYKNNVADLLSISACCITVAHGFGRIGCFLAGCCYGMQTDSFLGIDFPYGSSVGKVYPIQLYEAIFLFLLFGLFSLLTLKKKNRYCLCYYLASYGIWRFFIEYARDDYRGSFIGSITPSQFWSIVMVIASIILFIYLKYLRAKIFKISSSENEEK